MQIFWGFFCIQNVFVYFVVVLPLFTELLMMLGNGKNWTVIESDTFHGFFVLFLTRAVWHSIFQDVQFFSSLLFTFAFPYLAHTCALYILHILYMYRTSEACSVGNAFLKSGQTSTVHVQNYLLYWDFLASGKKLICTKPLPLDNL